MSVLMSLYGMVSYIDKLHLHELFPLIRTEVYNGRWVRSLKLGLKSVVL
jgi:hypothetical protein